MRRKGVGGRSGCNSTDPWRDWNRLAQSSVNSLPSRAIAFARNWKKKRQRVCISQRDITRRSIAKGFLAAAADRFQADNGRKALRAIDARGITARFNPWGVFIRRWQLDDVHIDSGEVEIQTYTPKPEPSPAKPWFHVFLPQRVYLKHVEANPADVIWRFRGEKADSSERDLAITPHGRDFNYQASGGTLKMALIPNLQLRDTHLLITGNCLRFTILICSRRDDPTGSIHAEGKAGTR